MRADATHGWIVAKLAAQGVDAGGLFRTLWPNSRWSWGPLAAPSWLAGYIGRSRLESTASMVPHRHKHIPTAQVPAEEPPPATNSDIPN